MKNLYRIRNNNRRPLKQQNPEYSISRLNFKHNKKTNINILVSISFINKFFIFPFNNSWLGTLIQRHETLSFEIAFKNSWDQLVCKFKLL